MLTIKDILIHAGGGGVTKFGATSLSGLVVILALASLSPVVAQPTAYGQKIDSLKGLLPRKAGLERAKVFYQLAYEYVDLDVAITKIYASKAFNDAAMFGDSLLLVKAGRIGALALGRNNEGDSSISLSLRILPVARRNMYNEEMRHILNRLGTGYLYKGKYDSSLIYYFRSLALREETGTELDISIALNNIGFVYYSLKDYDKALSFYLRSLARHTDADDSQYEMLLLNISLCYAYKGQFNPATKFVNMTLAHCRSGCSKTVLTWSNFSLGLISYGLNDFDKAKAQFSKSFFLSKEAGNVRFQLDNLIYLLEMARKTHTLDLNEGLLRESEALLQGDISYQLASIRLCHQLFESYEMLGNSRKMLFYQSKYIQLKDSVYNEGSTTNLMKVEADYMERENKEKLEAQERILSLSNNAIKRQKTLNVVVGIVAALSFALVFALIQIVKQKKRANFSLEQKVRERTLELELNHNLLLKSFHERDVQFQRMSNEVRSSLATIKGLGALVSHDAGTINGSNYLEKIEETSNNLIQGLNRVHDQQW